jgi:drug/metabolite transporter (DMT)-like permease
MYFAVLAAIGCSICNGVAAVLQKISADRVETINRLHFAPILKLFKHSHFIIGIALDLLAGVFILVATHKLPLFLVQSIIATSVLVTALIERLFIGQRLPSRTYKAAGLVIVGLICLSIASHPENVETISRTFKIIIICAPVVMLAMGGLLIKVKTDISSPIMAGLSGIGFGAVSIIGRVLTYPNPIWEVVKNPLVWALVVYSGLALFFFTAALQRTLASNVNAIMVAAETIAPLLVGILLLGDTARHGLWELVAIGCVLVVLGCSYIAKSDTLAH